jgi:eukaryotic-like serine/threonine-protein kinase
MFSQRNIYIFVKSTIIRALKKFFRFLKTRLFLYNLGAAILVVIIFFWGMGIYLNSYTRFGADNYVSVPDLRGAPVEQIAKRLDALELRYDISDSVFTDDGEKGTVWSQQPGPTRETHQKVKRGRKIYISIVSRAPRTISMPKLKDKSRRHAEGILRVLGLKSRAKYVSYSDCNDCVVEARYKGQVLDSGDRIPRGESVTLMLGRKSSESAEVVNLEGLTIEEARERLSETPFLLFVRECECVTHRDSARAVVYKQVPSAGKSVSAGSEISVWLKPE